MRYGTYKKLRKSVLARKLRDGMGFYRCDYLQEIVSKNPYTNYTRRKDPGPKRSLMGA